VVASAGNAGKQTDDHYQSCFAKGLGVGAINELGTKADFSNTGPCVDLVAPGERVLTTFDENDPLLLGRYALVTGTSISSPQVAGTAAIIKAKSSSLTADQIATRLQNEATDKGDPGKDDAYGYGLLNARCSVSPGKSGC
jgi:serine protease